MKQKVLLTELSEAFSGRDKPRTLPLGFQDPGSGEKEELESFLKTCRSKVDTSLLQWNYAAWYYFDGIYLAYFLPEILKLAVERPDNNLLIFHFIVWELERAGSVMGLPDNLQEKWLFLSENELVSVLNWLLYLVEEFPEDYGQKELDLAIIGIKKLIKKVA